MALPSRDRRAPRGAAICFLGRADRPWAGSFAGHWPSARPACRTRPARLWCLRGRL